MSSFFIYSTSHRYDIFTKQIVVNPCDMNYVFVSYLWENQICPLNMFRYLYEHQIVFLRSHIATDLSGV